MSTATSITVRVPPAIRHRPGRKTIVTPAAVESAAVTTRADPTLVKALARAFRYQSMLDRKVYGSVTEMAAAEKIDCGYLGRLLQLTLLSPDLVEAILDGGLFPEMGCRDCSHPFPGTGQSSGNA